MKYFICAADGMNLAIPAERTERVIPVSRTQTTLCETEDRNIFISLPVLLKLKDSCAPHGIVLKAGAGEQIKTVLLVPKIDIDLEIPEESIFKLPEALGDLSVYFKGACFINQNAFLILDPDKLIKSRGLR